MLLGELLWQCKALWRTGNWEEAHSDLMWKWTVSPIEGALRYLEGHHSGAIPGVSVSTEIYQSVP